MEKLVLVNNRAESITFSAWSDYHVNIPVDVTGLNDLETELYTEQILGAQGARELGYRVLPRYLTIQGTIWAADAAAALLMKRALNRLTVPDNTLTLYYHSAAGVRKIACRPEKAPAYAQTGRYAQFTLNLTAPDPYWQDENAAEDGVSGTLKNFCFPLELPEGHTGFEIETYYSGGTVVNAGDIAWGFVAEILFNVALSAIPNFTLTNATNGQVLSVTGFTASVAVGDRLCVDTTFGNKCLYLRKTSGAVTDYTTRLNLRDAVFPVLEVGENNLTLSMTGLSVPDVELLAKHANLYSGG